MTDILHTAYYFVRHHHTGQVRADGSNYIDHLAKVANLVTTRTDDMEVAVAALLHDALEDTSATRFEIEYVFGKKVLALVEEVTDAPGLHGMDRKNAQVERVKNMSKAAMLIKLADKIDNVRDLRISGWAKKSANNTPTLPRGCVMLVLKMERMIVLFLF